MAGLYTIAAAAFIAASLYLTGTLSAVAVSAIVGIS